MGTATGESNMNSSDMIEAERRGLIQTDDQYASHPSHKAAMVVRAVMGSIADIPDVARDLSQQDIDDLKLAHARFGDYLFRRLRKVA
jgi:hypothetical protein